jgi:hypothetical protein
MCLPQSFRCSQEYLSGTRAVVRRKRAEVPAFWVQQPNWWLDRPKPMVHFDGEGDRRSLSNADFDKADGRDIDDWG